MCNYQDSQAGYPEKSNFHNGTEKLRQQVFDLTVKGSFPVSTKLNLYATLGVAYVISDIAFTGVDPKNSHPDNEPYYHIAKYKWAPKSAVGMSYDMMPNLSVDTSWTHIQPIGPRRPGNIDVVSLGMTYHFS
jgi:OOP family OmpA-OmpF porin